jgi:hypothetical protein
VIVTYGERPPTDSHRIPLDAADLHREYVMSSDRTTAYLVRQRASGRWTCECPGFGYRERCRHVDGVRLKDASLLALLGGGP